MSRAELIAVVDRASLEDRLFICAYLEHLARTTDPEDSRELDERLESMRAGNEVSLEDARKLHDAANAAGI